MTRAELRNAVIEGSQRLLARHRLLGLSKVEMEVIQAQINLFSADDDVLEKLYVRLPANLKGEVP